MPVLIETAARMKARWARPSVTVFQPKKQCYQKLVDKVETYQTKIEDWSMDLATQGTLLDDIYKAANGYMLECKTPDEKDDKYDYIKTVRDNISTLIDNKNQAYVARDLVKWRHHPEAMKYIIDFLEKARKFTREPFELTLAVNKWIHKLGHGRQGAWHIMGNFLVASNVGDVQLQEGDQDAAEVLGTPSAEVNISGDAYRGVAGNIRRAQETIFDPVLTELTNNTTFQDVPRDNVFLRVMSAHIVGEVVGPYPAEA